MKKRILLIAPSFFGYHQLIKKALESKGWEVVYLHDRPPVRGHVKIAIRKFRFLFESWLNRYYLSRLNGLGKFEHILIIKGECITPEIIEYLRNNHVTGTINLYLWDSLKNSPCGSQLIGIVDRASTFDPVDAAAAKIDLIPLFFVAPKVHRLAMENSRHKLSFIGSSHGDRLKVLALIKRQFLGQNDFFIFVYFPSIILFYVRKFFDSSFKSFESSEVGLQPIEKKEVEEVFLSSVAILDIHHPGQSGLTMRTIESLALGCKLITTNETIKEYPFFDPQSICIIDRKTPVIPEAFFEGPGTSGVQYKIQDYEIHNWLNKVLGTTI